MGDESASSGGEGPPKLGRTKPSFTIDLPSKSFASQTQASQAAQAESILVNDKLEKARAAAHNKQPSMHAHFLMNDVVGHQGSRSRSGSSSDRSDTGAEADLARRLEAVGIAPATAGSSSGNSSAGTKNQGASPRLAPTSSTDTTTTATTTTASAIITPSDVLARATVPAGHVSAGSAGPLGPATGPAPASAPVSSGDPRLPQDDGRIHILIGATGSVSTGKLRQIIHKLEEVYTKPKVSIQVILTKAAEKFVSRGEIPSNIRIWRDSDEWATWRGRTDAVVHIELRRWADILVVAPLSANTLGKIALGLCDNLLTNVIRAWNVQYPILIAPAMSSYAYNHPATKRHIKTIKEEMKWIETLKPVEKVVGSYGDIGMGGMMDWNGIVDRVIMKLGGYPEVADDDDEEQDKDVQDDDDDDQDDDDQEDDQIDDEEDQDDDDDAIDPVNGAASRRLSTEPTASSV